MRFLKRSEAFDELFDRARPCFWITHNAQPKREVDMRRNRRIYLPCAALALAGCYLPSVPSAHAAQSNAERSNRLTSPLPLSEIVLYSSGVGYFQRNGQVDGRTSVDLRFKVDDINDLLKSMVVQDLDGGRVGSVTYGSRDPLTKTLKSFGLDLTTNPTLGQLLDQARGERIELLRPNPVVGTILGVERRLELLGENRTVESEFLNLLTADGLQSVPLAQVQRIRLLNEDLNGELKQALEALSMGHDTQKKTVSVTFDGEGKRKVSVAYIAQTPVWKTSYRLVLDEKNAPYLQGWAIVENTSDEDWENVRLSLVSGRPISFTMDLYQPLYAIRPNVQPELYSSLRPPVYGDAVESLARDGDERQVVARSMASAGIGGGASALAAAPAARKSERMLAKTSNLALADASQTHENAFAFQSVAAAAQGGQAGELFQYAIKVPVTLERQKSAMLPIVSGAVEGQKVSIYNEGVQAKYPLNGFRLKNSTSLHLMQGPVTVFDGGTYAGDARLDDLAAGQDRLISYALDIKTEVEPQSGAGKQELVTVRVRKGTLQATVKATEEKVYSVRNRDQKKKTVLIEHPFRSDWKLAEPAESSERTRDVYRFPVTVEAEKSARLNVREEKQLTETVQLINSGTDVIAHYIRAKSVSPAVKEALQKVVALRDRVGKTATERTRREQRVTEISQEQGRIRENMAKLSQSSDLYSRYVKKLDQQETELDGLRQEIENYKGIESKQQQELNDYLLNLDVS